MNDQPAHVLWFETLSSDDVPRVGGKNASLGEMTQHLRDAGIRVPPGFATTAQAYWELVESAGLQRTIRDTIEAFQKQSLSLADAGQRIRSEFLESALPGALEQSIRGAYRELEKRVGREDVAVAVRSSATAEDLPEASFAGQQESFLNVRGADALLDACRRCYASLFTDRAIAYRERNGFDHLKVALSVGVQQMVRSDLSSAGVAFSIDTETGFPHVVLINAAWGLGESVVQGRVDPDEYMVFKTLLDEGDHRPIIEKRSGAKSTKIVYGDSSDEPTREVDTTADERASFALTEDDILQLARWVTQIEAHYGKPMDVEWARDGSEERLYIVQARPETVESRKEAANLKSFRLRESGKKLATGLAIGDAVATGPVCTLESPQHVEQFPDNGILVTSITDPDWVPLMKRAAALVTDHGGRTSHAAIVSRELGLPAVVGTGDATTVLGNGQTVTVSCAEGDQGFVYEGALEYDVTDISLDDIPETRTDVMLNLANPAAALRWWRLPASGVGLARMEFIIGSYIKIHPMALVHFDELEDRATRDQIAELTRAYPDKSEYFVDTLARGIARIATPHYPRPVIVRMSDFKTNEYANLIGGKPFEPSESNPMLGWRGASRYYSEGYREGFALECKAIHRVRHEIGLDNVLVMIPFCRTLEESDRVLEVMASEGLRRGEDGLQVYVMCEIPSNVVLAEQFSDRFDGFSIGSNDLTQLVLGIDRDSDILAPLFDERNPAVTTMIRQVIERAHAKGRKVGFCGQRPTDDPDFARLLVDAGIDSVSVAPDSFLDVKTHVHHAEET